MRKTLGFSFLIFLSCAAAAQSLTPAERNAVDEVFAQYNKPGSPGCALGVYRDGAIVYEKGYGYANLEQEVPITPRTVFDIGSTSKQFTAFAILLLEKQGKLSLDDDVRKYLPELPDYGHTITLRHLITHTSGLRDYTALFALAGVPEQNLTTDQDALDLIARQKRLNFAPGEEWDYSNTGFFLLSQVVKRVSGKSIRDFSQENIFTPLGMKETQIFDWHGLMIAHRATGYSFDRERKGFTVEMSNYEQAGDGSVQTSVEDMQRWDENFYTGKLGGTALLDRMRTVGKLNNGHAHGYADGLFITRYRGLPVVRHGGAWAGYRAELLRFPQQHTSVSVLCNLAQSNPSDKANKVADVVLAGKLDKKQEESAVRPVKLDEALLKARAGWYRNNAGEYRHIVYKDGKLGTGRQGEVELVAAGENLFHPKGSEAAVSFTDWGMTVGGGELPAVSYTRMKPAADMDLSNFAGRYYSADLDTTWEIRLKDGKLTVYAKSLYDPPESLEAVGENTFTAEGGEVKFEPGQPMKMVVSVARVRGMEFTKKK